MYKEVTGLDVDGRYIRIMPNETYNHRWVAINELQILHFSNNSTVFLQYSNAES